MKKEKDTTKKSAKKTVKTSKAKKTKGKSSSNSKKDIIDLDNEIIIGLTPKKNSKTKQDEKNSKKKSAKTKDKKSKKSKNDKSKKTSTRSNANKQVKSRKPKLKKEKTKKSLAIKIVVLVLLIILCIVLFMLSSVFNTKEIKVNGNNKVTEEEIITLSELKTNENMFKTSNSTIKNRIKANPYIEDVKIKKKINGVIELNVTERVPTFIIKLEEQFAYVNNQGYILEVSSEPLAVPELIGISTQSENIKAGNRLDVGDLEKLDSVIKIISSAKSLGIDTLITSINITNDKDFVLYSAPELKTIYFGDIENSNDKMAWIAEIIEQKKGEEGEIFVKDLSKRVYFRKKI